jgi:hypothetical protein
LRAGLPWRDRSPQITIAFLNSPSSRRRRLNSGLNARDQVACTAKATLNGREAEHGRDRMLKIPNVKSTGVRGLALHKAIRMAMRAIHRL